MNFKEQMQQKAEEFASPIETLTGVLTAEEAFVSGSNAALTSDLVKGLVEALEQVTTNYLSMDVFDAARTALTNYKQEIKTLNEKQ